MADGHAKRAANSHAVPAEIRTAAKTRIRHAEQIQRSAIACLMARKEATPATGRAAGFKNAGAQDEIGEKHPEINAVENAIENEHEDWWEEALRGVDPPPPPPPEEDEDPFGHGFGFD